MRNVSLLIVVFVFLFSTIALASQDSYTGRAIDVADGDTITILNQNNESVKIRFSGIDCPEISQACAEQAKDFVVSKVSGRKLRIIPSTIDQYGRTVALVLINGENLNEEIVA